MIGASRSPTWYRGSGASGSTECCAVSSSPFPPMLSEPEKERRVLRMIGRRDHAVIAEGGVGKSDFLSILVQERKIGLWCLKELIMTIPFGSAIALRFA